MAKKKLKKKVQRGNAASKLQEPVMQSAREVWLAGLGALNVAQQEGGKIIERGSKLFERLVEEGSKLEGRTRGDIEGAVSDLRGEVESRMSGVKGRADAVRKQASDNWDKLEKIFEERVARALAGLGIPTRDDINGLSKRVQDLVEQVARLDAQKASRKSPAPAKKAPASKKTTKKAGKKATKKAGKKTTKKAGKKPGKKAVKKTVVKKTGTKKS